MTYEYAIRPFEHQNVVILNIMHLFRLNAFSNERFSNIISMWSSKIIWTIIRFR